MERAGFVVLRPLNRPGKEARDFRCPLQRERFATLVRAKAVRLVFIDAGWALLELGAEHVGEKEKEVPPRRRAAR